MKILFTLLILITLSFTGRAQNTYPVQIEKGSSKTIGDMQHNLWVITETQMDSAITTALRANVSDSLLLLLQKKIKKLKSKDLERIAINDTLRNGYLHYKDKWLVSDKKLEKTEKKLIKQKRLKYIFGSAGIVVGFCLIFLFH